MACGRMTVSELWDDEARALIRSGLEQLEVRAEGWEVLYRCLARGTLWLEDYPHSEEHGGGPMRLRITSESGQ